MDENVKMAAVFPVPSGYTGFSLDHSYRDGPSGFIMEKM